MAPTGCRMSGCSPLPRNLGGESSRWFLAPGGLWLSCFFPPSLHSPQTLAAKRPSVERLSKTHIHSQPSNQPKWSFDLCGKACPPLGSQAPGSDTSGEEATPLIGTTAMCPRMPAGRRHFTRPLLLVITATP